jgi:hypothetical protein
MAGYGRAPKGTKKFKKVMREYKKGDLHSGSRKGPKVTNPKQAVAIAYSEAKKASRDVGKYADKYQPKGKTGNPHKDLPCARHWG